LETFELYEHVVSRLDAMVNPHFYPEVIFGFTVLKNSLNYLRGLSGKLQIRDIGVFEANTMIGNIKSEIQCLRNDIGVEFQKWYDESKQLASYIATEQEIPRIPRVQCNR